MTKQCMFLYKSLNTKSTNKLSVTYNPTTPYINILGYFFNPLYVCINILLLVWGFFCCGSSV